jgi:hypothetical protein
MPVLEVGNVGHFHRKQVRCNGSRYFSVVPLPVLLSKVSYDLQLKKWHTVPRFVMKYIQLKSAPCEQLRLRPMTY